MTFQIHIQVPENENYDLGIGDLLIVKLPYAFILRRKKKKYKTENLEELNLRLGKIIKKYNNAKAEEKKYLEKNYNNAREILVEKNEGLIKKIIKDYLSRGLEYDDLFQAGRLGLFQATANWDYTKGKLSTHSKIYIKKEIDALVYNARTRFIFVPKYLNDKIKDVERTEKELKEKLKRAPTDEEIGKQITYDFKNKKTLKSIQVRGIKDILEKKLENSKPYELDEIYPSNLKTPLEDILNKEELDIVIEILNNDKSLNETEKTVLIMKFGLDGNEPLNNAQIGRRLGYSREMIRLISNEAKRKIRFQMQIRDII
ncbi:MAG: sigma-70 family RNA polymerase sigma factor [Candidatus Pacearchaeota archaeon]